MWSNYGGEMSVVVTVIVQLTGRIPRAKIAFGDFLTPSGT
jgi:hypothetical protein